MLQPFDGMANEQVCSRVENGGHIDRPKKCPPSIFSVILLPCFAAVPAARPSFAIINHLLHDVHLEDQAAQFAAPDVNFPRDNFPDEEANKSNTPDSVSTALPSKSDRPSEHAPRFSVAGISKLLPSMLHNAVCGAVQ